MKITIDTKEDSHEEIKKVIRMLSSLVGEEVMSNQGDLFKDGSSEAGSTDVFNMFNNPDSETKTEDSKEEKDKDIGIDIPELEEYR